MVRRPPRSTLDRWSAASDVYKRQRLNHAGVLNRFVAEALEDAGVQLRSLSAVAVGVGPGSYTGSRIGLSAAKGFCFALEIPLIGMLSLIHISEPTRPY